MTPKINNELVKSLIQLNLDELNNKIDLYILLLKVNMFVNILGLIFIFVLVFYVVINFEAFRILFNVMASRN